LRSITEVYVVRNRAADCSQCFPRHQWADHVHYIDANRRQPYRRRQLQRRPELPRQQQYADANGQHTNRPYKVEDGAMRGFHNSAFDPQTVVLLEAAFDEASAGTWPSLWPSLDDLQTNRSTAFEGARAEQPFATIVDGHAPGEPPQPLTLNHSASNPSCSSGWGSCF
jgi:hypothetical protein